MLKDLEKKSEIWKNSNFAHYAIENLTEAEKAFVRHPQNQPIINDPILSLFIIRAAFHYGGNWYYWFDSKKQNDDEIIKFLIDSLEISYQRVKYRILFALQFFSKEKITDAINKNLSLSSDVRSRINNYVLKKNVLLLFDEIKKKDKAQKSKVETVLREIEQYWPSSKLSLINSVSNCYKIFISFSKFDIKIAEKIALSLNNYFRGAVKVFFGPKDIKIGSKWKETILNALKEYDAIISLISQDTYEKPWIIAEFSAFWLQSKDIYILKYGDIDYNKIFNIFSDYQICDIQNESNIVDLIEVISEKAQISFTPFDKIHEMLDQINISIDETLNNRSLLVKINSKQVEVKTKELDAIANKIPPNANSKELLEKEIKEIAEDIGLFTQWSINPQLTYTNGDISWYFQQNYKQLKIESEFRAKYFILSIAENEGQIIPNQGMLSAVSQGINGEIERLWNKKYLT